MSSPYSFRKLVANTSWVQIDDHLTALLIWVERWLACSIICHGQTCLEDGKPKSSVFCSHCPLTGQKSSSSDASKATEAAAWTETQTNKNHSLRPSVFSLNYLYSKLTNRCLLRLLVIKQRSSTTQIHYIYQVFFKYSHGFLRMLLRLYAVNPGTTPAGLCNV